jgi:hypothetical protein
LGVLDPVGNQEARSERTNKSTIGLGRLTRTDVYQRIGLKGKLRVLPKRARRQRNSR